MAAPHSPLEPLFFHRILKEKVWGGKSLAKTLDLDLPFEGPLGETWELSDYPGEETTVRGGKHHGVSLRTLMEQDSAALLGRSKPSADGRFPLLVKFIDAGDDLSVQIHPADGPQSPTGVGKTEAWYILNQEPGSGVICGLKPGTTREVFEAEAGDKRVREHLAEIEVKKGDCVFVPSGQTHAIRAGVVLCEVQQTSDVTYRMYDWDRLGLDGQPRETHLQQALEVVDYDLAPAEPSHAQFEVQPGLQKRDLASCKYFQLTALQVGPEGGVVETEGLAHTLAVVSGSGHLGGRKLHYGDTVLVPGSLDQIELVGSNHAPLEILMGVAL